MRAFEYFMKIDLVKHMHLKANGRLLPEWNVGDPEQRRLKSKHMLQHTYFWLATSALSSLLP